MDEKELMEQQVTLLFIAAMADTIQYFIYEVEQYKKAFPINYELKQSSRQIDRFAKKICNDISRRYQGKVLEDFFHDSDLLRNAIRKFMDTLIAKVLEEQVE